MLRRLSALCIAACAFASTSHAAQSDVVRRDHVSAQLITADRVARPGTTTLVGLRLIHDPEWHTYWLNPGDSGLATKFQWTLPENVHAADIDWPAPHRIEIGELVNFGYDGELILPVRVTVPADFVGATLPLRVKASWLVCREECIPGDATFDIALDLGPQQLGDPQWTQAFNATFNAQPKASGWHAEWSDAGHQVDLIVHDGGVVDAGAVEIFPSVPTLIAHARGTAERLKDGSLRIRTVKSDSFAAPDAAVGVLMAIGQGATRQVFSLAAQFQYAAGAPASIGAATTATDTSGEPLTVAAALLLALMGGLLLNLMPCVLPILSLKALSLTQHAHDRARARRHGLLYFAGTVTCFLTLASLLLALRAVGESIGWGFQLQTPWVIAALAILMAVMGLSLSGAFQIGVRWMGVGQSLTESDNARGAFFSGALAAVVASPCTAPFMGPALGFAVTQPAAIALGVFLALGTGLSLPIVALSFAPALANWLPKPGAWMERFKQLLAYPLYLTAIWLLWVLGHQVGTDGMALALVGMLAAVLGIWLWSGNGRLVSRIVAAAAFVGAVASVAWLDRVQAIDTPEASAAATHEPWSASRFDALRAQGKPVLVNMTADWCITCLANERIALSSSRMQERLRELDIRYLKGDWTNRDAEITTYLAQFGRSGVPLYVLYPAGQGAPEVLPQLLTPAIVDAALTRAVARGADLSSLP